MHDHRRDLFFCRCASAHERLFHMRRGVVEDRKRAESGRADQRAARMRHEKRGPWKCAAREDLLDDHSIRFERCDDLKNAALEVGEPFGERLTSFRREHARLQKPQDAAVRFYDSVARDIEARIDAEDSHDNSPGAVDLDAPAANSAILLTDPTTSDPASFDSAQRLLSPYKYSAAR